MTSIITISFRSVWKLSWFLLGICFTLLVLLIKIALLLTFAPLMFAGGGGDRSYGSYDRSSNVFKVGEGW